MNSCAEAMPQLADAGYAIIQDCVPQSVLCSCEATQAFRGMPKSAAERQSEHWKLTALGRFHRVHFCESDQRTFEQLEPIFEPIVEAFFREQTGLGSKPDGGSSVERKIYRSELQLLTATPTHSQSQSWHADNVARGITIIVPLVDFSIENGATQILPGSHRLLASFFRLLADGPRVITPRAGSIAVYDARLYHRGLGNATASSRPALVFRYDFEETPPPGVGIAGSVANIGLAKVLHAGTGAGAALREALFG